MTTGLSNVDVTGDHDKSRFRVVETSLNVIGVRDNGRRIGNSEFLGIPRKRFTAKRKRGLRQQLAREVGQKMVFLRWENEHVCILKIQ